MYYINLFLYNFFFNSLFIQRLFDRNIDISINNLVNIQNDFINIGFPVTFTINFYFVSVVISIFSTILIYISIPKTIKIETPLIFFEELFKILINYSAVLFAVLYFFRLFNFSRGLIIFGLLVYVISSYLLVWFLRLEKFKNISLKYSVPTLIFMSLIFGLSFSFQNSNESTSITVTTSTTTTSLFTPGVVENQCSPWLGSSNFKECRSGIEVVSSTKFSESLNNIIVFENDLYILDVYGVVYKNSPSNIFLDISTKVLNRKQRDPNNESSGEAGLFSLAFHPSENYFLLSYSDLEDNLIVEKFKTDENQDLNIANSEIVLKIPNSVGFHYSGNLIYSNYFNDFILSVGDMEPTAFSLRNSEPIDTTSLRGKIFLLNTDVSNPEQLTLNSNTEPYKNLIAYGLRNPWKAYEYKNFLFAPDIGLITEEELNILNLDEISNTQKPFLLGWPHYEGTVDNNIQYNEINLYENGIAKNINNFVKENSIFPKVFYTHQAPENFRAALIGGGVIQNKESKYYEHYLFADYLSNELFSYDFIKDELFIHPLGNLNSFITSLEIHPKKVDTVLLTTGSGNLVEIKLP
jgi:hypothetical protein